MAISSRAGWALGLGMLGVAGLVSVSRGQGDGAVQKTSGTAPAGASANRPKEAVVGSIDLEAVFRGYEKVKFHMEGLQAEGMAKEGQLKGFMADARQTAKEMEQFQPGSTDFKTRSAKMTELKAKLESTKQTAEREMQERQIEIMGTFYKEVQAMTRAVAFQNGLTYVLRVSNEALDSANPEAVMAAMARPVVYADPTTDITRTVLYNLNLQYEKAGGQKAQAPVEDAGTAAPAAVPAAAPAAAPTNPATRPAPRNVAPPRGGTGVPR